MDNNLKSSKKKDILIIISCIILVPLLTLLFFKVIIKPNIVKNEERATEDKTKIVKEAEEYAIEYLKEEYDKTVTLKLIKQGNKPKIKGIGAGTQIECGHEEDVKEFIFEVKSDFPYESIIIVDYNVNTGRFDIGSSTNYNNHKTYEYYLALNNKKLEMIEKIKEIINNRYEVIIDEIPDSIVIVLDEKIEDIYENIGEELLTLLEELKEYEKQERDTSSVMGMNMSRDINIVFKDIFNSYKSIYNMEEHMSVYLTDKDIRKELEDYGDICSIENIKTKFNIKIEDEYLTNKEKYDAIFNKFIYILNKNMLYDYVSSNNGEDNEIEIKISFKDDYIAKVTRVKVDVENSENNESY